MARRNENTTPPADAAADAAVAGIIAAADAAAGIIADAEDAAADAAEVTAAEALLSAVDTAREANAVDRPAARLLLADTLLGADRDDLTAAMTAADKKQRATIRASLTAGIIRAAGSSDVAGALAATEALAAVNAAAEASNSSSAAPVDWQALVTTRAVDLLTAGVLLLTGDERPAGMPDDVSLSFPDGTAREAFDSVMSDGVAASAAAVALATTRVRRGGQTNSSADILAEWVPALSPEVPGGLVKISAIANAVKSAGGSISQGLLQQAHGAMLRDESPLVVPGIYAMRHDERGNTTGVNVFVNVGLAPIAEEDDDDN